MSRATFLLIFGAAVFSAIALAFCLYAVLGARWFSFYGPSAALLVLIIPFLWMLSSRYRTLGLRRWPLWIFAALAALPAIVQVTFWALFFSSKETAVPLAIGRNMVLEKVDPFLIWPALAVAGFGLWLFWRALSRD